MIFPPTPHGGIDRNRGKQGDILAFLGFLLGFVLERGEK
jgi:hypothetical protein